MKTEDFNRIEETTTLTVFYGDYSVDKAMRYRAAGYSFTVFTDRLEAILVNSKIILT